MSPGTSNGLLGLSPLYSRSPSASPSRSSSPVPSYHGSCLSSAGSSPRSDPEDRCPPTYSPIETFSDDEEDKNETICNEVSEDQEPGTSFKRKFSTSEEPECSPKRPNFSTSPSYITMYQPMYLPPTNIKRSISTSSATSKTINSAEDDTQIGIILQILSR